MDASRENFIANLIAFAGFGLFSALPLQRASKGRNDLE
jgi:hypothetical protein